MPKVSAKTVLFIVVLCIHYILSLYYSFFVEPEKISGDESNYVELAKSMLERGTYATYSKTEFCLPDRPSAYRPPVYPIILSALLKVSGFDNFMICLRLIQCTLGLLFLILIYRFCYMIFNEKTALLTLALCSFFQPVIYFYSKIFTEFFASLFSLLAIYFCYSFKNYKRITVPALLTGVFYCLATLTRPNLILLGPPILLIIWLIPEMTGGKKFAACVIIFAILSAGIGAWGLRNYHAFGKPCFLSTSGGFNLYYASVGENKPLNLEHMLSINHLKSVPGNEKDIDDLYYKTARKIIWDNPMEFIKKIPDKLNTFIFFDFRQNSTSVMHYYIYLILLLALFTPLRNLSLIAVTLIFWSIPFYGAWQEIPSIMYLFFRKATFCIAQFYPLIILGLAAILTKNEKRRQLYPVLLLIALTVLQNALILPRIRYRFIIEPYLLIFLSYGILFLLEKTAILRKKYISNLVGLNGKQDQDALS